MFSQLVDLFSGWYLTFAASIRDLLQIVDSDTGVVTNPEIWSAYVPWEHIIAAAVLIVLLVSFFKLVRCVLCEIL